MTAYRNRRYFMPVEVRNARGSIGDIGAIAAVFGSHPLIVTGRRAAQATGALDTVLRQLPEARVYEGVPENPTTVLCDEIAQTCRAGECDVVIAIGGGSPIDAAKAVAGLARNEGPCQDYIGADTFARGALPLIAIPTTAGAGSEVTPAAVLVDRAKNEKCTIKGTAVFPRVAVLDPELAVTLPRNVTINTGLDALSQAMEGIVSKKATREGDLLAMEAIRIIVAWLPVAADEPENVDAREHVQFAAMLAGCVIAQSGTTLVHGMGYPLTLNWGIANGMANALLLTPLFQFNARYAPARVAAIAEALGVPCDAAPEAAADAVGEGVHALMTRLGVSPAAGDHEFDPSNFNEIAQTIAANPYRYRNQIGDIDAEAITRFYAQAHAGTRA